MKIGKKMEPSDSSPTIMAPWFTRIRQPMSMHAFVPLLLGLLLLAAAGLKLAGSAVSPFAQYGPWTAPHIQALAIVWEVLLGLWLLSRVYPFGASLAAMVTFTLFASISGYLGWIGQPECGCFGIIRTSPWTAFIVDLIALALLLATRPHWRTSASTPQPSRLPGFANILVGTILILTALAAVALLRYGSLAAAWARLHGLALYAPPYVDFGSAPPGQELLQDIPVTNWTDTPIQLIGGTSDCSCIVTHSLPLTIPPGEMRTITVTLRPPTAGSGLFTRRVELWTDSLRQPVLRLVVGCRLNGSTPSVAGDSRGHGRRDEEKGHQKEN